jgi:hypothetical protein
MIQLESPKLTRTVFDVKRHGDISLAWPNYLTSKKIYGVSSEVLMSLESVLELSTTQICSVVFANEQTLAGLDELYRESIREGLQLPTPTVFCENNVYQLANYPEVLSATKLEKVPTLMVKQIPGNLKDAIVYSVSPDRSGYTKCSRVLKRNILRLLNSQLFGGISDEDIAIYTGSDKNFVKRIRQDFYY